MTTPQHTQRTITLNPYQNIDWSSVTHCRSQFHLHEPRNPIDAKSTAHDPPADVTLDAESRRSTPDDLIDKYRGAGYGAMAITEHEYYLDGVKHKGAPFFEDLDTTTWPWSQWGRGEADGMVPIEGAELRGTIAGVDGLHDIVSLHNDLGHGREQSLAEIAEEIRSRGGVAFLPHPGKYVKADSIDSYVELFETADALVGIEVFNANDRYPSRDIWDALLSTFGAERPVWGLANDDYHARQRPTGHERFDRSRTVLLVKQATPAAVVDALRSGRSYVQYDGDGSAPRIDAVNVADGVVSIESPTATGVRWIADGERVADGHSVDSDALDASFVRAEVFGDGGAVSCTQPVFLR